MSATPYTSIAAMRLQYGTSYIDGAVEEVGLDDASGIIEGVNSYIDGLVLPLVGSTASASVIATCSMFATSLATYRLYRDAPSDELKEHNKQALAFFQSIGTPKGPQFAAPVVEDDPTTPEDEAAMSGSASRQMARTNLCW